MLTSQHNVVGEGVAMAKEGSNRHRDTAVIKETHMVKEAVVI